MSESCSLALHFNLEFAIGTVNNYGNMCPIFKNGNNVMGLYFKNNRNENIVQYSFDYKKYFQKEEPNFFGNFFEIIEDTDCTFWKNDYEYPCIRLLQYSGFIDDIKNNYYSLTGINDSEPIITYISYSENISAISKNILNNFLVDNGFKIADFNYSISELFCHNFILSTKNSSTKNFLVLEALNDNLNISYIMCSPGEIKKLFFEIHNGLGEDPRTSIIIKFIVNKVNSVKGLLKTHEEKELEYKRLSFRKEELWKRFQMSPPAFGLYLEDISFKVTGNKQYSCLVKNEDIVKQTGEYVNHLFDVLVVFLRKYKIREEEIDFVILLGDSLNNDLILQKAKKSFSDTKVKIHRNLEISEILNGYFSIGIKEIDIVELVKKEIEDKNIKNDDDNERRIIEEKKIGEKKVINDIIKTNDILEKLMIKVRNLLDNGKVNEASAAFSEETSKIKNDDNATNFKIKEIEQLLIEDRIRRDSYQKEIKQADKLFNNQNYPEALFHYKLAIGFLEKEEYPRTRVAEIEKILKKPERPPLPSEQIVNGNSINNIAPGIPPLDIIRGGKNQSPKDNGKSNKILKDLNEAPPIPGSKNQGTKDNGKSNRISNEFKEVPPIPGVKNPGSKDNGKSNTNSKEQLKVPPLPPEIPKNKNR